MSEICHLSLVLPVNVTVVVCNHSMRHEESYLRSLFLLWWNTSRRHASWFGSWWHMVAGLHFTVCFFLIRPRSLAISKEWRGSAHAWCGWDLGRASAGWGVFPVGGGDGDEGGRSGTEDVVPADWRRLRLPSLQQQQEDSVKVRPPEFLEVPLRRSRKNRSKCDTVLTTDACKT